MLDNSKKTKDKNNFTWPKKASEYSEAFSFLPEELVQLNL